MNPIDTRQLGKSGVRVDCGARAPRNTGIKRRWTAGLEFDEADHLTDAEIATWRAGSGGLLKK